jgi:hypothetical protein
MNPSESHFYDGKLQHWVGHFATAIAHDDVLASIAWLHESISSSCHAQRDVALQMLALVRDGLRSTANIDDTNRLTADDILHAIVVRLRAGSCEDMFDLMIEQLADIRDGTCPQGRVARLMQIYQCMCI